MPDSKSVAIETIRRQINELDEIFKQASGDLNTVAGSERIAKWKRRTIPLLAENVGPEDARRFSATDPGPSFSNDLLEELGDEVEAYRNFLTTLLKQVTEADGR
jgi:hypothetical protein